jgi:Ethanolamine utilization protein EutJ (predicted chaperonin)
MNSGSYVFLGEYNTHIEHAEETTKRLQRNENVSFVVIVPVHGTIIRVK